MALPSDQHRPVEALRLMTLRLSSDGMLLCSMAGQGNRTIVPDKLRSFVDEQLALHSDVIIAVETVPDTEYGLLVDVLDKVHLAEANIQTSNTSQNAQGRIVLTKSGFPLPDFKIS